MSGVYKLFLDGFDDIDHHVIEKSIAYYLNDIEIINDQQGASIHLTSDMISKTPYRIGNILDIIETTLFKNRFRDNAVYKHYTLDWEKSELIIQDQTIDLSDRERDLLIELINAGDNGCVRETLLHKIWGYKPDLETHALETQIYRLRQKIEVEPNNPARLITIDNGYKLV